MGSRILGGLGHTFARAGETRLALGGRSLQPIRFNKGARSETGALAVGDRSGLSRPDIRSNSCQVLWPHGALTTGLVWRSHHLRSPHRTGGLDPVAGGGLADTDPGRPR